MNVIKRLIFMVGIILSINNILLGTEVFAVYYKNDITPPWGRVYVEKSAKVDGTTYVGESPVSVKIYAKDDMCKDEEIKYYISTEPISTTTKLRTWYDYEEGKSHEINLNNEGTGKVYTIFKDANGNTSLTYEANVNTSQKIIFDKNGGQGDIQGVEKERIYGMPYIIPIQMPFKNGHTFLGWSTDKEATVGSYRQGDAIPPDASLGTEESITLYAIYGNNLDTFPDLVDVVEIGDYVNYPVYYNNVIAYGDGDHPEYSTELNGWRVLKIDKENGEIQLVSAGVPLTLYRTEDSTAATVASKLSSTIEFLNISFDNHVDGCFGSNGFNIYNSLIDAFVNKYTVINSEIPEVRAMTKDDVDYIYKHFNGTDEVTVNGTPISDEKYKNMIYLPSKIEGYLYATYWLATNSNSQYLWNVSSGVYADRTGTKATHYFGVRPVVTLKPNIKAVGKDIYGAWDIEMKKGLEIPTISETKFLYTGTEKTLEINNFNSELMEITGTTSAIDNGTYTATISIKDTSTYTWKDGTTEPINIEWKISDLLVDLVEVGDYVAYTPDTKTYSTVTANTGASSVNLKTETKEWRVLDIKEDTGTVLITTNGIVHPSKITLNSAEGFVYGPKELNNISSALYSNDELGLIARSMTIEDLNNAVDYTPIPSTKKYAYYLEGASVSGTIDGYTKVIQRDDLGLNWTKPRFYVWDDDNGKSVVSTNINTYKSPTKSIPVKVTETVYWYAVSGDYSKIIDILGEGERWLASQGIMLAANNNAEGRIGYLSDNSVGWKGVITSHAYSNSYSYGLHPVIDLISTTKILGKDENGAWILRMD